MNNIDITNLKMVTEPKLVAVIKETFAPEIIRSIALGLGWTEKIKQNVQTEKTVVQPVIKENGQTQEEEVKVISYEEIEVENPKQDICFIADKFMDILFNESIHAIETHYRRDIIPETINTLLKPFDEVIKIENPDL